MPPEAPVSVDAVGRGGFAPTPEEAPTSGINVTDEGEKILLIVLQKHEFSGFGNQHRFVFCWLRRSREQD
jgi:hypothetical protein